MITKTIAIVPTPAARESAAAAWQRSFALPPETADPAAGARVVILDHDQARAEALAGMLHPVAQDVRIVAVDVEHEAMATPFAAVQERARATPSWSPPVSRTQDGEPVPHEDNGRERERGSVRSYRARIPDGVPPHDEEAELAVLGSMALDPEVVPSVLDIVGAPDFYRTAHKIVFETMDRIHSDGQPLDLVVIKAALEHAGQLEEVGGAYYLAHVLTSVPSAANAVHYARIVRDRARERTLITQAHGLIRDVHRGQLAPGDLATHYAEALGQVAAGADAEPTPDILEDTWRPASTLLTSRPPVRRWLLRLPTRDGGPCPPGDGDGLIPRGRVGILAAGGGTGKTIALCQLAVSVASGRDWLGFEVDAAARRQRVLLALAEEDADECHRRLYAAAEALGLSDVERLAVESRIVVLPLAGHPVGIVAPDGDGGVVTTPLLDELQRRLGERPEPWALIALDPLSRWSAGGAEGSNELATRLIQACETLAKAPGTPSVWIAHHSSKLARRAGEADVRGVTGLEDGARFVLTMTREEDLVRLELVKSNYARAPEPLLLERIVGGHGTFQAMGAEAVEVRRTASRGAPDARRREQTACDVEVILAIVSERGPIQGGARSLEGLASGRGISRARARTAIQIALAEGDLVASGTTTNRVISACADLRRTCAAARVSNLRQAPPDKGAVAQERQRVARESLAPEPAQVGDVTEGR